MKKKKEIPDASVSEICVLKRGACVSLLLCSCAACVRDEAGTKDAGLD